MRRLPILTIVLLMHTASCSFAQSEPATTSHRWIVYGGIGPNMYINNLQAATDKVKPLNYAFVARLMWEPEYRLRIGFETGYNQLYRMSGSHPATGEVNIVNAVIPIQGVVSMTFFKNFYGNFNIGFGMLLNNVSTANLGNFDASIMSLGDFAAGFGYRRDISERFTLGGEIRGYHSTKLQDTNIGLTFMAGYRLW